MAAPSNSYNIHYRDGTVEEKRHARRQLEASGGSDRAPDR
jgi:hypothetical protein